jgi:hypothetical protein
MTDREDLLYEALDVWAPDYPRRVNRTQEWTNTHSETVDHLLTAEGSAENAPYISTYSFPNGHTKHDNIPRINTLFIDFDFEDGDYTRGSGNVEAWRRDLSHLLVRVRRVAQYLHESGRPGWRASLSGHKGVHLFLDFPALDTELGAFRQYTAGLSEYADDLLGHIADEIGMESLHEYVDVTSSDLGRLCRVPNTLHGGATDSFGEDRYCVPVSIEELADITVDDYVAYTQEPRGPRSGREPNERVGSILSQYIRSATTSNVTRDSSPSIVNWSRVSDYQNQSNDRITLGDIEFLTSDRPCVWKFYNRDDKYRHGFQSHYMEMYCIRELVYHNAPIDVIVEFLDSAPEFNETYSRRRVREVIAHDYNRFSVEAILRNAPEFCGYDDCSLCQSILTDEDELSINA